MWIVIESQARIVSLTEDSVKTGGPFKQSKSGNATAADLQDGLTQTFKPASEFWHAGFIFYATTLLMHDAI